LKIRIEQVPREEEYERASRTHVAILVDRSLESLSNQCSRAFDDSRDTVYIFIYCRFE